VDFEASTGKSREYIGNYKCTNKFQNVILISHHLEK
jgi:hypothetical protein